MEKITLHSFCQNIGEFCSAIIINHLKETGILKKMNDPMEMKSIDFPEFIEIWRETIGPKYYAKSILPVERQIEILIYLSKIFPLFIKSKKKILSERVTPDITKPAWFTINPSDSNKGTCLKMGFNNHGCDYWRKSTNNIGCYNCGFFINLPENQNNIAENIIKQFNYTTDHLKSENSYDSIEFVGDGSFFNVNEVPEKAQQEIFQNISQMKDVKRILVESRPEFINTEIIDKLLSILRDDQHLEIGVGLETTDKFIATFCINKGFLFEMDKHIKQELHQKDIFDIIEIIKPYNRRIVLQLYALIKPAFLNEIEALNDSLNTGRAINKLAIQNKMDLRVKYEPVIIAKGTLLEVLHNTWVTNTGELIFPETKKDKQNIFINAFVNNTQINAWKQLYTPPSYWTVAELIAKLSIDDSHKIARFGSRQDMHVPEMIPGVYDYNQYGAIYMFNQIDFVLYNAVQQFNVHKNVKRFINEIRIAFENQSYNIWKDDMVNLIFTQLEKSALEFEADTLFHTTEADYLRAVASFVHYLHYSKNSQQFFINLLNKYSSIQDAKIEIKKYMLKILSQKIKKIVEQDIEILSADYNQNKHSLIDPSEIFRIDIILVNHALKKDYSIAFHIPNQQKTYEQHQNSNISEIERKYIVEKIPDVPLTYPINITQGYISITKENEVRIRKKIQNGKSKYTLTWKSKGDKIRDEIQSEIDKNTFVNFIPATNGKIVEKDRYQIKFCFINNNSEISFDVKKYPDQKSFTIELDIYKGHLFGLMCAEVEFETEEESRLLDTVKPEWFAKEVTFDKRFKNQSLSKYKLDSIFIQPSKKYENDCLCFSNNRKFINCSKKIAITNGLDFKLFSEMKHIETKGEINADVVDLMKSTNLVIIDSSCMDINVSTKLAVRETMSQKNVIVDSNNFEDMEKLVSTAIKIEKNESTISMSKSVSVSKIIENQHLIDNETLGHYEQKANEIWVVTSSMEFDIGELKEVVKNNLDNNKKYVYFIPHESCTEPYSYQFHKNLKEFKKIFCNYMKTKQVLIKQLNSDFVFFFKEIIIYNALYQPFGFTYYINKISDDFELLKIENKWLYRMIDILKNY